MTFCNHRWDPQPRCGWRYSLVSAKKDIPKPLLDFIESYTSSPLDIKASDIHQLTIEYAHDNDFNEDVVPDVQQLKKLLDKSAASDEELLEKAHKFLKNEKKCFDDLVPIIDKQTPHLTLDYDVIEQGKQVPRKSQGSVSLSLPLSTMSENTPMSENSLSSHVHDCLDWEMCSEAGQGGTQQGHDECLEDTCDLENDCQSDNEDCNGDDNFANKLGNINIREIIGNLKAVMDTLYHWQDTKERILIMS